MPELPEVETTRRGVAPYLLGKPILDVIVREARLRWPVPPDLGAHLRGTTVVGVGRRAKYLLIDVGVGTLLIHLGMSGSLRFVAPDEAVQKHDHVDLILADRVLRYRDPRRFGAILWHPGPPETHPLLSALGPEPLGADFDGAYLFRSTRRRGSAVKLAIMDNHLVVGVGNIYANEALFYAGIGPLCPANALTRAQCDRLAACIVRVLTDAIAAGGSTLRDFVGAGGQPGYFQQSYQVYARGDRPCHDCGELIRHIRQGQRSSFYCPRCQPC